jgi:hypothetical protein
MQERREGYKGSRYKGDPDAREDLDLRVGRREADVVLSRPETLGIPRRWMRPAGCARGRQSSIRRIPPICNCNCNRTGAKSMDVDLICWVFVQRSLDAQVFANKRQTV